MPAATPHTATTLDGLLARLAEDRDVGLAWSDGHFEPGIGSVAAAVHDATGRPVAAINVSGQLATLDKNRAQIGAVVAEAAAEVSARLGFSLRRVA
jgi:DNA-binding IclR family transcriptional regulator